MPTPKTTSLKKARLLYHKKKYSEVISLLEKDIFQYYEDVEYFLVLGSSFFATGDLSGADAFFQRINKIDQKNIEALLGLCLISTIRGDVPKAVKKALEVLDILPHEPRASKILNILRKKISKDELRAWTHSRDFLKFYPKVPGKQPPYKALFLTTFGLILVSTSILLFPWVSSTFFSGPKPENLRPGIKERGIEGMTELIKFSGGFTEILRVDEIQALFKEIQDLLQEYRDNEARKLMNRLLRSNASDSVKEQVYALFELLQKPDFTSKIFPYTLKEISDDPGLYQGVFVRWQGSVANLEVLEENIIFDLLVGYHEGRILEGVAKAELGFAVRVDNGDPVDVLAQIKVSETGWNLVVQSIHVMGVRRSP